jgi:hypothetical protein
MSSKTFTLIILFVLITIRPSICVGDNSNNPKGANIVYVPVTGVQDKHAVSLFVNTDGALAAMKQGQFKIVRFGDVLSLAPDKTYALNTSPPLMSLTDADLACLNPAQFLMDTLSPKQFDLLSGVGLTFADLDSGQQKIFRDLLPDPWVIEPVKPNPDGAAQPPGGLSFDIETADLIPRLAQLSKYMAPSPSN